MQYYNELEFPIDNIPDGGYTVPFKDGLMWFPGEPDRTEERLTEVEAQTIWTALMTDTLLESDFMEG